MGGSLSLQLDGRLLESCRFQLSQSGCSVHWHYGRHSPCPLRSLPQSLLKNPAWGLFAWQWENPLSSQSIWEVPNQKWWRMNGPRAVCSKWQMEGWWINTPTASPLCRDKSEASLHFSKSFRIEWLMPTAETSLMMPPILVSFLSLTHIPTSLQAFPWITS